MRTILIMVMLCFLNDAVYAESRKGSFFFSKSYFHVLVYSDGILSGLGHDHVIAATQLQGHYTVNDANDFLAQIQINVRDLIIDRKADRVMYPHLATKDQPSIKDIAGTNKNMLGKDVLNAKQYPMIHARLSGNIKKRKISVRLSLAGHDAVTETEYKLVCDNGKMKAKGQFHFQHADLGLAPFSALFGAIKVAERLDFNFSVITSEYCPVID